MNNHQLGHRQRTDYECILRPQAAPGYCGLLEKHCASFKGDACTCRPGRLDFEMLAFREYLAVPCGNCAVYFGLLRQYVAVGHEPGGKGSGTEAPAKNEEEDVPWLT